MIGIDRIGRPFCRYFFAADWPSYSNNHNENEKRKKTAHKNVNHKWIRVFIMCEQVSLIISAEVKSAIK